MFIFHSFILCFVIIIFDINFDNGRMASIYSIGEYFSLLESNREIIVNQLILFKSNINKKSSQELKNEASILNQQVVSFNLQLKSLEFFYLKFLHQTHFNVKCFDEQSVCFLHVFISETNSELVSIEQPPQNLNRRLYNKLTTIVKNLSLNSSTFVKNIKSLFFEMEDIKKHFNNIQLCLNKEMFTKIQTFCDTICLNYINHKPDSALTIQVPLGPCEFKFDLSKGPFAHVAIDGFGPYQLTNRKKYWGLILVCLGTRCIRLTLLEDLSSASAAQALNFIWDEVGRPISIVSDNGTNFVPLKLMLEKSGIGITWWTSTPKAPWQNGSAERLIRTVKSCLRIYQSQCKSLFQVQRRFKHIEMIVNSRPIVYVGRPISAFEMVYGRPYSLKEITMDPDATDPPKLFKWRQDRLNQCIKTVKNRLFFDREKSGNPWEVKVGDFVLLPDKSNKLDWPVGQVEEIV